jgi:hypothetical protein
MTNFLMSEWVGRRCLAWRSWLLRGLDSDLPRRGEGREEDGEFIAGHFSAISSVNDPDRVGTEINASDSDTFHAA